jgi:sugar O-acyltransferase (sialic acid O-acetyltransferase NeuD family)
VSAVRKVVLIGAGDQSREAIDVFAEANAAGAAWEVLGVLVEPGHHPEGYEPGGTPILGDIEWLAGREDVEVICAVGAPELRRRLVQRAKQHGARFCTLIHPSAVVSENVLVGAGTLISAGCVVTCQARLGEHVHLQVHSSIHHDAVLGDFATLTPGVRVCGHVRVGEGAWFGVSASVVDRVEIGAWSRVGAGAVVLDDVPANATVVGQPARVVSTREDGWHQT